MKPQITTNKNGRFPLTDYNFQPTVEPRTSSAAVRSEKKSRAFWKVGAEFFGAEAFHDYVTNFLVFTVIAAATTWPIISMIVAVTRMVQNY